MRCFLVSCCQHCCYWRKINDHCRIPLWLLSQLTQFLLDRICVYLAVFSLKKTLLFSRWFFVRIGQSLRLYAHNSVQYSLRKAEGWDCCVCSCRGCWRLYGGWRLYAAAKGQTASCREYAVRASLHQCHGCTHRATPCYWSPSFRDDFEHACLLSKDVPTEVRFGHLVKIVLWVIALSM